MQLRNLWAGILFGAIVSALPVCAAFAGAELKFGENAVIDLGVRLHGFYVQTEEDTDSVSGLESVDDFRVRRARLLLNGSLSKIMAMGLQTEFADDPFVSTGSAAGRLIDAYGMLTLSEQAQFMLGKHMAPGMRTQLTSAAAMMTIDRPGLAYKSITWGCRSVYGFGNAVYTDSDSGLRDEEDLRDTGITLFGTLDIPEQNNALKYYGGIYNGINAPGEDSNRFAGRVQLNMGEAEKGYFDNGTYLGKKQTIAVGYGYDTQKAVGRDAVSGEAVDYRLYSIDFFSESPLDQGSLTVEGGYVDLSLGGTSRALVSGRAPASQTEGHGVYAQAGYLQQNIQPWIGYERWNSEADTEKGSYYVYRFGLTYYVAAHNANIKGGYEIFNAREPVGSSSDDKIKTLLVGVFINY
ncbi:MAG: hypothetical protein NC924_03600 [Candidatus Omnitrophica bacterium]|nr:hypothetical protein [Candidatus Omnitrophota bacterium]